MKIDMHCHVKEGSIDSKVGLEEYITILKKHGFQGMVITDMIRITDTVTGKII